MNSPSFDTWTSLFLIAAFQGIFLFFLIVSSKKDEHPGKNYLASLILFFSLMLMFYVSFWTGYNIYIRSIESYFMTLPFSLGALLYLYSKKISGLKIQKSDYWHLAPWISHILLLSVLKTFPQGYFDREFLTTIMSSVYVIQVFQMLLYSALLLLRLQKIQDKESDLFKWHKLLSLTFLPVAIAHALYYVMIFFFSYVRVFDYMISVCMTAMIYIIGYSSIRFNSIVLKKQSAQLLTRAAIAYYRDRIIKIMEEEKPFLEGSLKIADLANLLDINTHALSQLINESFGKNYSEFINDYRIKEAENLLINANGNSKVIEIAYQSGFNTKAAFYSAFRRKNNISPKEFQNHLKQKSKVL